MNPWKGIRELPKNIWLIAIASLINRSGTMVIIFLALFVSQGLGESLTKAGLVVAVYGLGSFISAPFVGRLSDKIGELRLMKLSLLGSAVFLFIFSFAEDYYTVVFLSFVWSILSEAFRPASLSFISNESTPTQRKTAFALYRLAVNLGMSIGPVLGGILSQISYDLLFYVDGGTSLIAWIFLSVVKWDLRKPEKEEQTLDQNVHKESFFAALSNKQFFYLLMAVLPVSIIYMQAHSTFPLFVVENLGFSNSTFGMLVVVNTILIILLELPLNASMANWKTINSLYLGALLTGIGFGFHMFSNSIPLLVLAISIWTFGEMIFFPGAAAMASEIAPPKKRGEYMGFYQMAFSFSFMAAPYIGTTILEEFNSTVLWATTFFLSFVTVLLTKLMSENEKGI